MTKKALPSLSADNAALLQWKLGRAMTPGLKVTLTVEALGVILDACRVDEQAHILERQLDGLTEMLKTENAMAEAVGQPKH